MKNNQSIKSKIRAIFSLAILATMLTGSMPIYGIQEPRSISTTEHIKLLTYHPDSVHYYRGYYGYQSSIVFEPDEIIQTVTLGDSSGWQFNNQKNRLLLKPILENATTNATIITSKRVYHFELHAQEAIKGLKEEGLAYEVRFVYPLTNDVLDSTANSSSILNNNTTSVPDLSDPEILKSNYGINLDYYLAYNEKSFYNKGLNIIPLRVFDDGIFTYFKFRDPNADLPAVFFLDANGYESLANFRISEGYLIVERVAPRMVLRHGKSIICVFNEKMHFKRPGKKD